MEMFKLMMLMRALHEVFMDNAKDAEYEVERYYRGSGAFLFRKSALVIVVKDASNSGNQTAHPQTLTP